MNKIKKNFVQSYTVDMTDAYTVEDLKAAFALGKHNAQIPLTNEELFTIINYTIDQIPTECICNIDVYEVVKKPWYKRFWNWMTRKNK